MQCVSRRCLALGLLAAVGCGAAAQLQLREPDRLLLAFVGAGEAALEPSGPTAPLGGVARLSALVLRARSKARRSLFLDSGGSLAAPEPASPAARLQRARRMLGVYRRTSLTALNIDRLDLMLGEDLPRLQAEAEFPFLSANLQRDGVLLFPASGVFDGPGGRIGVTGVLDDRAELAAGFTALDPIRAAARAVRSLRDRGARLVIVLSGLDLDRNRDLARSVAGIDLILGAGSETEDLHPIWVETTAIVSTLDRFQYLGLLELQLPSGPIVTRRDLTAELHGGRAPGLGIEAYFELAPSGPRPRRDPSWRQPEAELWLAAIPLPVLPSQPEDEAIRALLGPAEGGGRR